MDLPDSTPWRRDEPDARVPDSPQALFALEAQTQQQRSEEVFSGLRRQLERLTLLSTPDAMRWSFHVAPGVEKERSVFFENCRRRPGSQVFSFSHVIVNDMSRTMEGDRCLDIREFAVFGGHNAIVCNKSMQTVTSEEAQWALDDSVGPVLLRVGDGQVRIVRGRNNRLMLPVIKKKLTLSEIFEQRVLADDLTRVLSALDSVTLEEHFRLAYLPDET